MRAAVPVLLLGFALSAGAQHNLDQAQRDRPDLRVLAPSQLPALAPPLRADLDRRGCKVTMFAGWDGEHNVIRGSFLAPGSRDVAVLCLADDDMGIVVYPLGEPAGAQEIRRFPADAYRMIHRASQFVLSRRAIRDRIGDEFPPFDHDGIDDAALGGRSETAYHHDGRWLTPF